MGASLEKRLLARNCTTQDLKVITDALIMLTLNVNNNEDEGQEIMTVSKTDSVTGVPPSFEQHRNYRNADLKDKLNRKSDIQCYLGL